jgi:hypothetical protein
MRRSYYTNANVSFSANIASPADGTVSLDLTNTQTSALKPGRYVYDVELVSNVSTVERLVEGIITVYPEATK